MTTKQFLKEYNQIDNTKQTRELNGEEFFIWRLEAKKELAKKHLGNLEATTLTKRELIQLNEIMGAM